MKILFDQTPPVWGLRGDRFLWDDLRNHFSMTKLPRTEEEVVDLVRQAFKALTNEYIHSRKQIYIEKYDQGGMSSGLISCDFWETNILPFITKRFHMLNQDDLRITHKFSNHEVTSDAETLIIGTFNPDLPANDANFFYSRGRNYLWRLLPTAFGERDLKGSSKEDKVEFITRHKIALVDLIEEVTVDPGEGANYDDDYIDARVTKWRDVIGTIENLPNLKRVCFTRKTFSGIPNMKGKLESIRAHCNSRGIQFKELVTPARYYREDKQVEWTNFLLNGQR